MANYAATKVVNVFETVQEAVADLETQLELVENTNIIRTCDVIAIEGTMWASVLVYTAVVA